jgi:adenylate cyclase
MEHKHQFTDQDNKKARVLFQRAVQLDPKFARAYVGLAWTHNLDIDFGWTESREQSLEDWVAAARRAIASDPYDSEARTALGTYYQYLNDFPRAGAEIGQSLELNPNHADRLAQAAWYWGRSAGKKSRAEGTRSPTQSPSPGLVRRGVAGDSFSQPAL